MQIIVSTNIFGVKLNRICNANNKYEFNKVLTGTNTQTTNSDVTPKQCFIGRIHQLELIEESIKLNDSNDKIDAYGAS